MPNATANGIALSAIDRTGRNIDLCSRMDAALSQAPNLASYQNQGYVVVVELSKLDVKFGNVTCSLDVEVVAPVPRNGMISSGARLQAQPTPRDIALAIDDCTTAVIENIFVRAVFP